MLSAGKRNSAVDPQSAPVSRVPIAASERQDGSACDASVVAVKRRYVDQRKTDTVEMAKNQASMKE